MSSPENFPYIHGFSPEEQERLREQARFGEHWVYRGVDFSRVESLIEVGCGVGAQSEILLRRFPNLHLTGVDLSEHQLAAAQNHISQFQDFKERATFKKMSAEDMTFSNEEFDGAFLCWILEHVPSPLKVLSEVQRVLRPGSPVYVTEVMNSTFFLEPYSPHLWKYWMAFNDYQYDQAGDPFIGAKLGQMLIQLGFQNIETEIVSWHLDSRKPKMRHEMLQYWKELLLSASDQLMQAKYVDEETVTLATKEMDTVIKDPQAVFLYSFMQAKATVG